MTVEKDTVVSVHYRLQSGSAEGELVEETFGSEPLVFLFGAGQMIPEFERNLLGKKAGESIAFGINCSDAYGEVDQEAIVPMPISTFRIDGELAEDLLVVGEVIPMSDEEGNQMDAVVRAVREDHVVLDFNHPMAGQDLYFSVEIHSIREATATELNHGHVHGPGGHDH